MFIKSRLKHKLSHIFLQGQWLVNNWTCVEARGASMTEAEASNARRFITSRPRSAYSIQIQPNAGPPIAHSLLEKFVYIKYTNIRDDGQGCLHNVKNTPLTHWDDLPTNHQPAIIEG